MPTNTTTTTSSAVSITDLNIDYSFLLYVLFAILVGLGGAYYAMKNQKTILAIGIIIASIAIFWFFGTRWFNGFKLKQDMVGGVDRTITWPPQINYCPDFLSLTSTGSGTTLKYFCVDSQGVTKTGTTGLPLFTEGSTPIDINEPRDGNALKLITDTSAEAIDLFKQTIKMNKLIWEGIYDGNSFSGAPFPSPYLTTTSA